MKFFNRGSSDAAPKKAKQAGPRELTKRADRYAVKAPMRFRRTGHLGWQNGTTINFSKSGVLFLADAALPLGTQIEISISLPQKGSNTPKDVAMSCVVTRHRDPEPGEKRPVMAAKVVK